jgi:Putative Flp pilus-assembly TadE/G-like
MRNLYASRNRYDDRGVSILMIAVAMIFVLGMAGLGIDLASLYVGRNQAQRAADAGALAAAQYVAQKCTAATGSVTDACAESDIKARAVAVTNANYIAGVSPDITASDVTILSYNAADPQIRVIAGRDTAHTNPMPTFFVKIFGIYSANVSATAVAEAYNPSGGDKSSAAQCLKPWLMPNCNWGHLNDVNNPVGPVNNYCQDPSGKGIDVQFVNTPVPTPADFNPADAQPVLPESQTRGELLTIKSGDPSTASGPSQFYPVYLPIGGVASACPSCANKGGGGPNSSQPYENNIECCNSSAITCGPQFIQPIPGNMVGPTAQGVDCLIHEKGGSGQDTIQVPGQNGDAWTISAGSNNPYGYSGAMDSSDSIVTIPLYDGTPLCPGGSCKSQVKTTIVGFLQTFIVGESSGNVTARVMNVVGCPDAPSPGSSNTVAGGGSSPIPVRLIHE